jgi:phosphotransacetylase
MNEIEECKEMVESYWKSFLAFSAEGSIDLAKECLVRFEERIAKHAKAMGNDGKRWMEIIDEQRDLIFDEYTKDPNALKTRLGISPAPQPVQKAIHATGQNLGELAVRTAVRATVWESIISIFRLFR